MIAKLEEAHAVDVLRRNLRLLREARNLSQAELGQAAGISRNHYQLLETGRAASGGLANPRLNTLRALADVLGVRPESLIIEPVVHSVWRWSDTRLEVDEDHKSQLLSSLLDSSATVLGGSGAAFIGSEPGSLTLGIAIAASDGLSAEVLAEPLILRALTTAGLEARLLPDVEVTAGIDGLVSDSEF